MTSSPFRSTGLAGAFLEQAEWCRRLGSTLYTKLLEVAAADVTRGGPAAEAFAGLENDPPSSAVALRVMGAIHRLVLEGRADRLAQHFPSVGGQPGPDAGDAFLQTIVEHSGELRSLAARPVQTNEVGRSAALLGGFLTIAAKTRKPLRLLEIGASAGLNLLWDRFRYETPNGAWGDPDSPVRLSGFLIEGTLPLDTSVEIAERAGCDIEPLDVTNRDHVLTLTSFVWADQLERLALLKGALEMATTIPVRVERAGAVRWLQTQLRDSVPGVTTVVYHSIVAGYLPEPDQVRLVELIADVGRRSTPDSTLAWLRMEPGDDQADVHLTIWPEGDELLLAKTGFHGRPLRWLN